MSDTQHERSWFDGILDELLPDDLEWRRLVRGYPKWALAAAALGGFYIGRTHGREIVDSVSNYAADSVTESVNELVGRNLP